MEFFGRKSEIGLLRTIRDSAKKSARFTVVSGRRRIGKTSLLRHALDDGAIPYLHLPITRQPEKTLCAELQEEIERVLHLGILGTATRFSDLFAHLMAASKKHCFTVVLDEFQEFDRINPAVFGQMAAIWDRDHGDSKINLVVCGSIARLVGKIFFDDGEPLYGRTTGHLRLQPFKPSELKEIFSSFNPDWKPDDLYSLWVVSGGVARYVDMMLHEGAFSKTEMLRAIFSQGSPYLPEGQTILAEEFGADYGTYFAILAAISGGATTSGELKNLTGTDVSGFLSRLESHYGLISKKIPFGAKESSKNCHFQIDDCFFRFWFRFVYRNRGMLELERFDRMLETAERDFDTFGGYALERYFWWKFVEEGRYVNICGWWNRKGEDEIDLVCDDGDGGIDFCEVKRNESRIDEGLLRRKAEAFLAVNPSFRERRIRYVPLSLNDM